ncbi:hypothetical protein LguiB_005359 [Lonicera macranthoides]
MDETHGAGGNITFGPFCRIGDSRTHNTYSEIQKELDIRSSHKKLKLLVE